MIKKTSKFDGSESLVSLKQALQEIDDSGAWALSKEGIKGQLFEDRSIQTPWAWYETVVKIVVKKVGKEAEEKEIVGSLKDLQEIVGGYAERLHLVGNMFMLFNEEGILQRLPLNIIIKSENGPTPIVGNVCFIAVDEEGEMTGLNDFQMNWIWLRLKEAGHATDREIGAYRLGVLNV